MNGLNRAWELSVAVPDDAPGIRRVFDDGDFKGGISVKYGRAPDPYQSFLNDGERIVLPVVKDAQTHEILGLGGCVIRRAHVNGVPRDTAYLTGMKLLSSHRRRINCIAPAYKLIGRETAALNPFYYTTILESNEDAIRLLEKRRRSIPPYVHIGDYTVLCLGAGKKANAKGYRFFRGHTEALAAFYAEYLPRYNLSPHSEWLYGLRGGDFYGLQSPNGSIVAACALWNQQSYKQYIISGYGGIYRALSHIPIGWLGYPVMPKAGAEANYLSIAAMIVKDDDPDTACLFLRLVLGAAAGHDFVMLGLFENHPLLGALRKFRHIAYRSRLYAVDYSPERTPDCDGGLDGRPVMLEVGLL